MKMLPHNFNTVKLSNAYFVMKLFQIRNSFIKNNPTFSKFVAEHLHQPGLEALLTYFLIRKIQYKKYDFLKFKKEILGDKEISINKIIELVNDNLTKKFDKESQKILLFKHLIFNTIQELERENQTIPLEMLKIKYKTLKSTSHFLQKNSYHSLISFDFNKWSLEELNNTIINYQNLLNGIKTSKDFNLTSFLIENKEDIESFLLFLKELYEKTYKHKISLLKKCKNLINEEQLESINKKINIALLFVNQKSLQILKGEEKTKVIQGFDNQITEGRIALRKMLKVFSINKVPLSDNLKIYFEIIIKNLETSKEDYEFMFKKGRKLA